MVFFSFFLKMYLFILSSLFFIGRIFFSLFMKGESKFFRSICF